MPEKKLFKIYFSSTQLFLCVENFSEKLFLLSNFRIPKKEKDKNKERTNFFLDCVDYLLGCIKNSMSYNKNVYGYCDDVDRLSPS